MSSGVLVDCSFLILRLGGQLQEGLLLTLTPYILEGEYFLKTALNLTSCHNWVVPRLMPLMLCEPLIAWMVMSVKRQAVQHGGLCVGMTRTGCNRSVFSPYLQLADFTVSSGKLCFHLVCLFQYLDCSVKKIFKILVSAYFSMPVPSIICACFTVPNSVYYSSLLNIWSPLHIHVAATM